MSFLSRGGGRWKTQGNRGSKWINAAFSEPGWIAMGKQMQITRNGPGTIQLAK